LRLSAFGRGAAKQSINHAGKETNAQRNEPASTFLSLLARLRAGFCAEARFRSSRRRSPSARGIPASR